MKVRPYSPLFDAAKVASWFQAHNWPALPAEALPKCGLMVSKGEDDICAAWLYKSDSSIAWLEWVISNPQSDKMDRSEALNMLIKSLLTEAKSCNYSMVFTSVNHPSLIKRYKEHGFQVGDSGDMTNMIARL